MQINGNNRYRRKDKTPTVQLTARIHTQTFEKLEKICKAKNVSLNFMLNRALTDGLKRIA